MDDLQSRFENFNEQQAKLNTPSEAEKQVRSAFRHDSTFGLVKKLFIYKVMGSNIFINYSLLGMNLAYKLMGVSLTNLLIEQTAGSIFTGGVTLQDLRNDIQTLQSRGIGGIGCYVVEGLRKVENEKLDGFLDFSLKSIDVLTERSEEGHFALKLTAFMSTELMEKLSLAQKKFVEDILCVVYNHEDHNNLTLDQLRQNLASIGIDQVSE